MQDISNLPEIDLQHYLVQLQTKPFDERALKQKCDRLFAITECNQSEYMGDVQDVYAWLLVFNGKGDFKQLVPNERIQKYFCGDFLSSCVKNLILCKRFRLNQMMLLTEGIFVECIKFFNAHFHEIDRFPGLAGLLFAILRIERLFYKQNAITNFPHLVVQPSEDEVAANNTFVDQLKEGDIVDALKVEMHGNRMCWSRAVIKKATPISVYVSFINDQLTSSRNVDKSSFEIVPLGTFTKNDFDWRLQLKAGDKVDFETSAGWLTAEIEEVKVTPSENPHKVVHELRLKCEEYGEVYDHWAYSTSPKIQKPQLILNKDFGFDNTIKHDRSSDDFNDLILDQAMKGRDIVVRSDVMKSLLFVDIANLMNASGIFQRILNGTEQKTFGVEVCAEFVNFIMIIQTVFHRRFAVRYLKEYSLALVNYVRGMDDNKMRNLSKERLSGLSVALKDFFGKLLPAEEKRNMLQQLERDLALRFINSDFLEKKMQAVTIFTELLKQAILKPSEASLSSAQLSEWFLKNDIMKKIFNEKSHSELVSRGADFLHQYLIEEEKPDLSALSSLLEYSEPLLKLNNDLYQYLPVELREQLVERISQRQNVTNKDALEIMRKFGGNENWFLKNGGEMWVEVVKAKKNKAHDVQQVFTQPFAVVAKITGDIQKCYDGRFKNQYFEALLGHEYLRSAFQLDVPLTDKIKFFKVLLEHLLDLNEDLFQQFMDLWKTQYLCDVEEFYEMFDGIICKSRLREIEAFFERFFKQETQLQELNKGGFRIFSKLFLRINELRGSIDRRFTQSYTDTYPARRERKEILTITVDPSKLFGMDNLMQVVFESQSSQVVEAALEFIGFLFGHLAPALAASIREFKDSFLQQCLDRLYKSSNPSKYLQIVRSILDQSEKDGNGNLPSLEAALPGQKLKFTIVDSFSVVKKRFQIEAMSNITVFEFRFSLGKEIGAFVHQISLSIDKKPVPETLNGYTLRQANLGQPILVERKGQIEKAELVGSNGKLTEDARRIFEKIFNEYSTNGLMSKEDCQKFHQKCVGQTASMSFGPSSESKVDKIFSDHDADKDGNLELKEFLEFYENASRMRSHVVWNNLQNFGVRPDLKILDDLRITHAEPSALIRHLLVSDHKFMELLLKTLESDDLEARTNAWALLERLPLYQTEFQFNFKNPHHLKYWLYLMDGKGEHQMMTKDVLEIVCNSDAETLAIGLKSVIEVKGLDLSIFQTLVNKLDSISIKTQLTVFEKLSLDSSLSLIVKFLANQPEVQKEFVENKDKYESVLLNGLLSVNANVREKYSSSIWIVLQESCEANFPIFEVLFTLLYRHFETSTKSSLHPEFFDLFSKTLELVRDKTDILVSLKLDWKTLTKSVIERFKTHRCTEERISSPPDWVVQGFMHILSRLLDEATACDLQDLIPYLFQTLLFPEGGTNKLKTAASRKEAYELIYTICKANPDSLESLFRSGFRKVYKGLSANKAPVHSYFSIFYNDVRADCGYAGVRNLGCICYMIAMIQQFYLTKPLRYLLLMADDGQPEKLAKKGSKEIDDNVLHQFQSLFAHLELTERQEYDPNEFCFAFKDFDGNPVNVSVQQDAQEFLNMLFDRLQRGLGTTPFKRTLQSIYGGTSCNQLICSGCKNVKEREEHFYSISLDIKGLKNIDESLKKFIQGEVISDYLCDSCGQRTDTVKRTLLSSLPNYLIIHMQRICFNYDKFENQKINSRWEFPHALDVYPYTADLERKLARGQQYQYRLKGIVVHVGSAEYGHYFSYIRVSDTQWLEFNDERVREFDPDDIEHECFGGDHWRRENQSAYLLVYEKVVKKGIELEFESQEQMEQLSKTFELPIKLVKQQKQESDDKEDKEETETEEVKEEKKQEKEEKPGQEQPKEPKKDPIIGTVEIDQVPYFVPEKLVSRINKSNEDFSMTINVSNNEFAHFIYRILSIEPPQSLKSQFLELCHQCFHFKQQIGEDSSLSDWMVKRFKQLIVGSGWSFFDQVAKTWEKDILSSDKHSRAAAKNVLVAVLTDILTPELIAKAQEEADKDKDGKQEKGQVTEKSGQKEKSRGTEESVNLLDQDEPQIPKHVKVLRLLDSILAMMEDEVPKSYYRLEEYFEFWYELLEANRVLLKYAESRSMVEYLLNFIMQDNSPFKAKHKHSRTLLRYNCVNFEGPMELLGLFIKEKYTLSPEERECFGHISYLEQLIKCHPANFNLVEFSCRENSLNTERLAYLILFTTSKISHSDDVKPIMVVTRRFLAIDDSLRQCRIEWLLGYPQLAYNAKLDSFGLPAISNPFESQVIRFRSGLRHESFLQILEGNRFRHEHISARQVTMLMELEAEGYFNLSQIESPLLFNKDYSSWIPAFSKKYFEESRRMKGLNYISYGDRIVELIDSREPKERTHPSFLIGCTIQKRQIWARVQHPLEITLESYSVPLVPSNPSFEANDAIPSELSAKHGSVSAKTIKKYAGAEKFFTVSPSSSSSSHFFMTRSADDDEKERPPEEYQRFADPKIYEYILKLTLKNTASSPQIAVLQFQKTQNAELPLAPISFEVDPSKQQFFAVHKIHPDQPLEDLKFTLSIYPRRLTDRFGTNVLTQLITPFDPDTQGQANELDSDDENHFSY